MCSSRGLKLGGIGVGGFAGRGGIGLRGHCNSQPNLKSVAISGISPQNMAKHVVQYGTIWYNMVVPPF